MSLLELAWKLSELLESERSVFFKTEPEVPDFTIGSPFKVLVYGQKLIEPIVFDVDGTNIREVVAQFDHTIFNKDFVDRLYTWNFKSFCSYFHHFHPTFVSPTSSLIDLKVIESFLGIRKNRPENLTEAINRAKIVAQNKSWMPIYKAIHQPLTLRILPCLETRPLLNEVEKQAVHPYYDIEGQNNGRLNCLKKYAKSYLPHNMGPDVKKALKPRGYTSIFLVSDFRHCEVTVLQWLSGDEKLKELIDSGGDLHAKIYETITGGVCDSDVKRKKSKLMFLPVMYGCGAATLSKQIDIPENVAVELINRIKKVFGTAWGWIKSKQELAKTGIVLDYFGRPRIFPAGEAYKAQDFVVQSVAATVCEEKMIELHTVLDPEQAAIAFSVHDGLGLVIQKEYAKEVYQTVKKTLESESKLCPGLKMKIEVKFGKKLDTLKVLWKD